MYDNVHRPPEQSWEGEESRAPLAGPAKQLWPATLAGPAHEAYVAGVGQMISPATPATRMIMKEQTLCHDRRKTVWRFCKKRRKPR